MNDELCQLRSDCGRGGHLPGKTAMQDLLYPAGIVEPMAFTADQTIVNSSGMLYIFPSHE